VAGRRGRNDLIAGKRRRLSAGGGRGGAGKRGGGAGRRKTDTQNSDTERRKKTAQKKTKDTTHKKDVGTELRRPQVVSKCHLKGGEEGRWIIKKTEFSRNCEARIKERGIANQERHLGAIESLA